MATFGTMTIADALATPVNHTFVPASNRSGLFEWQDQTSAANPNGVPVGFNRILASAAMSKDNGSKGRFALDYRFVLPTLETVSNSTVTGILPAPTWGYDCTVFIKFVASNRSSLQNRKDAAKMAIAGFQNLQLSDWYQTYQMPT